MIKRIPLVLRTIFFIGCLFWLGLGIVNSVSAQTSTPPVNPVYIYLFWGDGCPHCAITKPYLESLQEKFPGVELRDYEIYYVPENQDLFFEMASKFGFEPRVVPTYFIGVFYSEGYTEDMNPKIEAVLRQCLEIGCPDPGEGIIPTASASTVEPSQGVETSLAPTLEPTQTISIVPTSTPGQPISSISDLTPSHILEVPFLGVIDLDMQSITLSTALIAFVDGFNPCSLWVLSMLLALTVHTGSRRKVFIISLVFLTVTAGIYALFIAGLFSVLKIVSFFGWIQVIVALVAFLFGAINIKDYFWYKEGISFTIADDKKGGIFKNIRRVLDASQSTWGMIGATVVLAVGVSTVEFSCTAGFPVLWTNLLTTQNIGTVSFIMLLLLYMLIYQLDEVVIFLSAVISLKASRLEEKHGRLLKLTGGMLMLTLAGVMLINPGLMDNLLSSLLIFVFAFLMTILVAVVHRRILPRFGIRIGTENK